MVSKLQAYISATCYTCTARVLTSLGKMYVSDARFQNNIDRFGAGTAEFVAGAIEVYCRK
ncbi:MAG: hypothetical protein E7624_05130 [Ruminococcaceae bacterium]|nr:hypothetical protein [Oscillospiraceae bacterium]